MKQTKNGNNAYRKYKYLLKTPETKMNKKTYNKLNKILNNTITNTNITITNILIKDIINTTSEFTYAQF